MTWAWWMMLGAYGRFCGASVAHLGTMLGCLAVFGLPRGKFDRGGGWLVLVDLGREAVSERGRWGSVREALGEATSASRRGALCDVVADGWCGWAPLGCIRGKPRNCPRKTAASLHSGGCFCESERPVEANGSF